MPSVLYAGGATGLLENSGGAVGGAETSISGISESSTSTWFVELDSAAAVGASVFTAKWIKLEKRRLTYTLQVFFLSYKVKVEVKYKFEQARKLWVRPSEHTTVS